MELSFVICILNVDSIYSQIRYKLEQEFPESEARRQAV